MDNLQHSPDELPPYDIKYSLSIVVLIYDDNGYCVARYDYLDRFWFMEDGYIPARDNSGVHNIKAWWYLPEYKEGGQ